MMADMRNPPPGYQTVSPYLLFEDAQRGIDYLKSAFGFKERLSMTGATGRSHTERMIGDDGLVMVGQAWEGFKSPRSVGASPPSLIHVYVDDVDALHSQAQAAGAEVTDLEMHRSAIVASPPLIPRARSGYSLSA